MLTRPGTYNYFCRFHVKNRMQGTVIVESGSGIVPGAAGPGK